MKESLEKKILEFLEEKEYASVPDLAKVLFVSPSTVRRTLEGLQAKGLVTRTHGGARLNKDKNVSPSFTFRFHQNSFEKKKMALSAIKLINNGDIIFLDGSTSAYYIAEYLKEFENIKVITNGIDTLSLLAKNKITAYSTGGQVSTENPSVLVGRYAEDTIESFYADVVFFSAQALCKDGNIYDCFEEEIFLRRAMIKNAKKVVFLCDNTKINKISPYRLATVKDLDYIVTNEDLVGIEGIEKITVISTEA